MPYDFTYVWNLKNKINKQNKSNDKYREHFDSFQIGEHWVKKMKGWKSANWQLQNNHGDAKYSTGNIVNNIVISMCGVRWVLDLLE